MEVGFLSLRGRKNGDGALYFAQNPGTTFLPNILTSITTIGHADRYAPTHGSPGIPGTNAAKMRHDVK